MANNPSGIWHGGRLGSRGQRWLKAMHLVFSGLWLGGIGSAALCLLQDSAVSRPGLLIAAHTIHDTLVFGAFVGTLTTGLLFSLLTKWGFFTHDWISAKWLLALVLFALTLGWQAPALSGLAGLADAGLGELHGHSLHDYHRRSVRLAGVQLAIVALVFVISTLKPWGRRSPPGVDRRLLLWLIGVPALLCAGAGVFNHVQLRRHRTMEIATATARAKADGEYTGRATCGVPYEVAVSVRGGSITAARATRSLDNHYAQIGEAVLLRIEARQTTDVDAITGATTTSRCLTAAVADALR